MVTYVVGIIAHWTDSGVSQWSPLLLSQLHNSAPPVPGRSLAWSNGDYQSASPMFTDSPGASFYNKPTAAAAGGWPNQGPSEAFGGSQNFFAQAEESQHAFPDVFETGFDMSTPTRPAPAGNGSFF